MRGGQWPKQNGMEWQGQLAVAGSVLSPQLRQAVDAGSCPLHPPNSLRQIGPL